MIRILIQLISESPNCYCSFNFRNSTQRLPCTTLPIPEHHSLSPSLPYRGFTRLQTRYTKSDPTAARFPEPTANQSVPGCSDPNSPREGQFGPPSDLCGHVWSSPHHTRPKQRVLRSTRTRLPTPENKFKRWPPLSVSMAIEFRSSQNNPHRPGIFPQLTTLTSPSLHRLFNMQKKTPHSSSVFILIPQCGFAAPGHGTPPHLRLQSNRTPPEPRHHPRGPLSNDQPTIPLKNGPSTRHCTPRAYHELTIPLRRHIPLRSVPRSTHTMGHRDIPAPAVELTPYRQALGRTIMQRALGCDTPGSTIRRSRGALGGQAPGQTTSAQFFCPGCGNAGTCWRACTDTSASGPV